MATTIDQQVPLDESLVPSTQRAFQVTSDVPEIYMQEFWATTKLHHNSIRFKIDTKKSVEHKNQKRSNEMNYPRFTKVIIDYFMTRKPSISRRNKINWHYVRDDALFSTIKVVSRHQTTQQYGAILPIELTTDEIRNNEAYKEYYACAMGEAAPKPKASVRKKKGDSASSTTPPTPTPITTVVSTPRLSATAKGKQPSRAITPTEPTDVQRIEAEQLKVVLKRSRQETHISQQSGSGTDEGTGSKPGVLNVPSDDSEEEILWNSSDDEDVSGLEKGNNSDESDDERDEGSDDDSDETVKAGAGKLSNITVEERLAFNVSLRMFTQSIVIKRRVEDLQLGVKSYQKRLNLTMPDTTQQPEEPEKTLEEEFKDLYLNLSILEVLAHAPMYNGILDKYMEGLDLGKNGSAFIQEDLGHCVNIIPLYLFKKLNIGLLEETNHVFGLADGTKSYPTGIVRDVEVYIGRLKLLIDFFINIMKKDPETYLLVGRGFVATANAVIDYRKTKIAVGERITRKDFLDCHLPEEWEIARDAEINPFKNVRIFRRMVEFLGAIPVNLKRNMWESKDLIRNPIN
nr:hypothetical protein [Tanacetum cinerariifolium]